MFVNSFTDDVAYVTDVEVCMECMICYIPGSICYGSEDFFDCDLCMIAILDLLAHPHNSIP